MEDVSEKQSLDGLEEKSLSQSPPALDLDYDMEKAEKITQCYALLTSLTLLAAGLLGLIEGIRTLRIIGNVLEVVDWTWFIGFVVTWVAAYVLVLRNPEIRYGTHPNKKLVYIVLIAWSIPLFYLILLTISITQSAVVVSTVPLALAVTLIMQRIAMLDRCSCLRRLMHPVLLIPLSVLAVQAPLVGVQVILGWPIWYAAYIHGLPFAVLLLVYVHCNIEVCLRDFPAAAPIPVTHQLLLDVPNFAKPIMSYFRVNTAMSAA